MHLILLPPDEARTRAERLARIFTGAGIDTALISDNANKYYLTGRIFDGWLTVDCAGSVKAFVRRPTDIEGRDTHRVRKPEEITLPEGTTRLGIEFSTMNVALFKRLETVFTGVELVDISASLRSARAVKTPYEVALIEESGRKQTEVYNRIPSLYHPGMTDLQLQIELEHELRVAGCLGQFRISGDSMELFMGNILAGDNADNPAPYDFAMGGAGSHPSLPVGADNTVIRPGMSVMVDANGNFTGYMTDMTRTFRLGEIAPIALLAHQCSIDICEAIARSATPGVKASALYDMAVEIAADAGLADFFMGHRQKAGFIGHGVGIEVNEAPVLAPRSRDIIAEGNVIALEPKFVIPGTGAVGIENTYLATPDRLRCLTHSPEALLPL